MNRYIYYDDKLEFEQEHFIDAETIGKARYKIWLKGASEYYETFGQFIKNLRIRRMMNREIKFRGKRIDNGEWVYGNLLKLETDYFTDSNDTGFIWYIIPDKTNGSLNKEKLMLKFISPCYEVVPETVGQYAEFKDRKGNEVYEGDIGYCDDYGCVGEVIFDTDNAMFMYRISTGDEHVNADECLVDYIDAMEIIGDVYDNPGLLEVEKWND